MTILSNVIGKGTEAARPAFGKVGRLYYNEDDSVWERDSGTAWVPTLAAAPPIALDGLTDVNAPSPSDTQALIWDSETEKWIPGSLAAAAHDHDDDYYTETEIDDLLAALLVAASADISRMIGWIGL